MPPRKQPLAVVPDPPERPVPPDLRVAVAEALAKMTWLGPSDEGLKALAQRQAYEIETAVDRAEEFADLLGEVRGDESLYKRLSKLEAQCDATKAVGWLGPQLQGVLRDLGGTPAARKAMAPDSPVGGRLANLRKEAADAQSGSGAPVAKRPPSRRTRKAQGLDDAEVVD